MKTNILHLNRVFIFLIISAFTLPVYGEHHEPCEQGRQKGDCETTEAMTEDTAGDPSQADADQAESPWQGTWTGSENSSFGNKVQLTVKIKVTKETISGTWNVFAEGLKPITGQVEGEEATITILQGGSMVKATLVDKNTFKYSGIRGYGTLTKQ